VNDHELSTYDVRAKCPCGDKFDAHQRLVFAPTVVASTAVEASSTCWLFANFLSQPPWDADPKCYVRSARPCALQSARRSMSWGGDASATSAAVNSLSLSHAPAPLCWSTSGLNRKMTDRHLAFGCYVIDGQAVKGFARRARLTYMLLGCSCCGTHWWVIWPSYCVLQRSGYACAPAASARGAAA
jgi:hypothetical protein